MLMFSLFFVLYFVKLSVGIGVFLNNGNLLPKIYIMNQAKAILQKTNFYTKVILT